jgi:hypothetical protein
MKRVIFAVLIAVLIVAGCVKPIEKLGCCLKDNISDGCVLYNLTTLVPNDFAYSVDSCDDDAKNTSGHCNVSIGTEWRLIPICSQDDLVPCIDPGCTAMLCGDFEYSPTIAPGITSTEKAGEEALPTNLGDEEAMNFYKAQCRFLPMDAKLRQVMSNSRSQINVFRMGVGESFDTFDQYR